MAIAEPTCREIELAVCRALRGWQGDTLRPTEFTEETIREWLKRWMLSRATPNRARQALLIFLNGTAMPLLSQKFASQSDAASQLEELTVKAKERIGLRPTSLMSKLGAGLNPHQFVPYDKRVRSALRTAPHDYKSYVDAFRRGEQRFTSAAKQCGLIDPLTIQDRDPVLLISRATDKYLMAVGGFNFSKEDAAAPC